MNHLIQINKIVRPSVLLFPAFLVIIMVDLVNQSLVFLNYQSDLV